MSYELWDMSLWVPPFFSHSRRESLPAGRQVSTPGWVSLREWDQRDADGFPPGMETRVLGRPFSIPEEPAPVRRGNPSTPRGPFPSGENQQDVDRFPPGMETQGMGHTPGFQLGALCKFIFQDGMNPGEDTVHFSCEFLSVKIFRQFIDGRF
jgi:hypothetical protein